MTKKRRKGKKSVEPKKKVVLEESKSNKKLDMTTVKKYLLILLQAFSFVCVCACICVYSFYSSVRLSITDKNVTENIALADFKGEYYDNQYYTDLLTETAQNVIKLALYKSDLETEGAYDPRKEISISEFAHRDVGGTYTGPDATYYLGDLISWGQFGVSTSGISHSYKVFDSWNEMYEFFGGYYLDEDEYFIIDDEEISDNTVPMLDVIDNRFYSVDGLGVENYAYDADSYNELTASLEKSAIRLYSEYKEYQELQLLYDTEDSNIRYYIRTGSGENDIYTNLINYKVLDSQKLSETFKAMGEYIYACPQSIEYLSNTNVPYESISTSLAEVPYFFPSDTVFWLGLDTTYPVNDIFAENYSHIEKATKLIPFLISIASTALIAFIALMVIICLNGIKRLQGKDASVLKFLDKTPVETEILLCALLTVLIYLFELFIDGGKPLNSNTLQNELVSTIITSFLYSMVGLLFLYSFIRRGYLHVLFKNSFLAYFIGWLDKRFSFVRVGFFRVYDSAGTAIRTWTLYLLFLIFNTFWACMLFFSSITLISFLVLLLFDGATGVYLFNRNWERKKITDAIEKINEGDFDFKLDTTKLHGDNRKLAETVNRAGDSIKIAVETSSRDEKLKADLITNVSHDIKTPLTSIINYVGLIKRENIDNERVQDYIQILDEKSQRLKQLTIDLVEASKITSGNITLELMTINVIELLNQALGEFDEKFTEKNLTVVTELPHEALTVEADARYVWRIIENLFQNVYKYALRDTRVYIEADESTIDETVSIRVKNISANQLNIDASELTERFIRGDVARSTEGSGLGLSIVKSLVKAHNGSFDIYLDGDLFKATVTLPKKQKNEE